MSLISKLKSASQTSAFDARVRYLGGLGYDVSIHNDAILEVSEKLARGVRSLVLYGEPQAGKTEAMIALVCRLLDEGHQTIFVIMNDNTELEIQNFDRFKEAAQINPSPMTAEQFNELPDGDKKAATQRVIFCRKNKNNLEKLLVEARFLKKRVVIDDEADFASPDTNINKPEHDPTTINRLVSALGELSTDGTGTYIGVTATPGRLNLNGTFANDSSQWVFMRSHKHYKGRSFFFPISEKQKKDSNYALKLLPDEGDDSKHLKEAFLRFLVRAAIVNLDNNTGGNPVGYSMLVHTEGRIDAHEADQTAIQKHLSVLIQEKQPRADQYAQFMLDFANAEIKKHHLSFTAENILSFVLEYIGKSSTLVINHKKAKTNVKAACDPKDVFTFAFGGNIVSRGLTFKNLLTFFFSRSVKNKFQQNTYIQRARMFGNRPYSSFFELCVPRELFKNWAECFTDHELSLRSAMAGNYVHISHNRTSPADSASIEKVATIVSGDEWMLGQVAKMPNGIEELFSNNMENSTIGFIDKLLEENILAINTIDVGFWELLKGLSEEIGEEPVIVLSAKDNRFLYPGNFKDFDEKTITRARGGLVSAPLQRRPHLLGKQILMPIRNKFGEMRIYYKSNQGLKTIKRLS